MNTERLIHDYIDGTLEHTQEEQLFMSLSSNDELRNEFRQQMAIKNAIQNDTKSFTPKAGSEAAIFGALGFSSGNAPIDIPKPAPSGFSRFWAKYSQGFIGGIAASVATILLMIGLNDNDDSNNQMADNSKPEYNKLNIEVPVSESYADNKPISEEQFASNQIISTKDIFTGGFNGFGLLQPDYNSINKRNIEAINRSEMVNNYYPVSFDYNEHERLIHTDISSYSGINKHNLSIEIHGNNFFSNKSENIKPSETQPFNNFGATVFYKLNNEIKFGLGYQRENYYQTFIGVDNHGYLWEYEQKPNFQTFTLDFRYSPEYLSGKYLKPALQLSVGGNQAGPVGKAMIGSEIKINPYFNLMVGGNWSILGFHHQNRFFTSDKFGLYIGTGVNL